MYFFIKVLKYEYLHSNVSTLDVYKPAGVIAGKRKQLEASEEGGKYIIPTWSQIV